MQMENPIPILDRHFILPWNQDLLTIKNRVESLSNVSFNSVLLNEYTNGE